MYDGATVLLSFYSRQNGHPGSIVKTASGVIALILGLLTVLNIAGCSKAEKEYRDFAAYNNSTQGGIEGFMRGWSGASQGDPFGPILSITDQERSLVTNAKDARWSAWACLVGTALALLVWVVIPSKQPSATVPAASPERPVQGSTPPVPPRPEHTVEERLRTLLQLRESGLITTDEYDARTRQIVESI